MASNEPSFNTETGESISDVPTLEARRDDDKLLSNDCLETKDTKEPNNISAVLTDVANIDKSMDKELCDGYGDTTKKETIDFKVIFNKKKYDVTYALDETIASLKNHIQTLTGVPPAMQKVMFKGLAKDDSTLRTLGVTKACKIMVVGSTLNDVLTVAAPSTSELKEAEKAEAACSKEPLCKQKMHQKVLEKHGKPDDAMVGVKNKKEPLPPQPVSGMYNKSGGKVRLTFKLEVDQIWIGTKERTDKIPMNSIKAIVSEPLENHEDYHLMGIQLGPTEASRYWIYWVPAQYVDAIKDAILGKWQYF